VSMSHSQMLAKQLIRKFKKTSVQFFSLKNVKYESNGQNHKQPFSQAPIEK